METRYDITAAGLLCIGMTFLILLVASLSLIATYVAGQSVVAYIVGSAYVALAALFGWVRSLLK